MKIIKFNSLNFFEAQDVWYENIIQRYYKRWNSIKVSLKKRRLFVEEYYSRRCVTFWDILYMYYIYIHRTFALSSVFMGLCIYICMHMYISKDNHDHGDYN